MQPTRWHHCKWQHSPANHNGDDSGPDGDGDGDGPDGEDNKEDKTRQMQESQELNFQFPFLAHLSLSSITITRNI